MTMHRIVVLSMLAMTTVLALLYVSTFPADGSPAFERVGPTYLLETGNPAVMPAGTRDQPAKRVYDADAMRSLA